MVYYNRRLPIQSGFISYNHNHIIKNYSSIPQQNHGISFLDQSIQNAAAETARNIASLNQQPSSLFGQLSSLESHQQYGNSALDLPMTTEIHQQSSLLRSSYSHQLIPGTSQTAQMIDQISSQKCSNVLINEK